MDSTYKGEQVLKAILAKQETMKEKERKVMRWSRDSLIHDLEERAAMWELDDIPSDEEVDRRKTAIASILEDYRVVGKLQLDEEVRGRGERGRERQPPTFTPPFIA